ncbi:Holliday junction resolvase RuvX [Pectinatus sottacetonis]|uniref:Holliday junction resolvase RuvX n=1 Tax=Pectinatus sottacetonis TaxID=1002795 RepID=UPI0018C647CF|nr:Holliday junction resolvase RuvX [Pectinatus sottacetonis]
MDETYIMAIDPGRDKSGIAVLSLDKTAIFHKTILTRQITIAVAKLREKYQIKNIVIGSGTTSKKMQAVIKQCLPEINIHIVDEYRTTDAAKKRYWQKNPPKGLRKIIPRGMLVPPVPVDDLAAIIIGEKFLDNRA